MLLAGGRPIIDWVLDRLCEACVERAVVNLHYEANLMRSHLQGRTNPYIDFSDETELLLDTGGGVAKALPMLGDTAFFVINGDVLWFDDMDNSLLALARRFLPNSMDALLLLQPTVGAIGYNGVGDYMMLSDGQLRRRSEGAVSPFIHSGIQILKPDLFKKCPGGPFSLNLIYDQAEERKRLFGLRHEGQWVELNHPEGLAAADKALVE